MRGGGKEESVLFILCGLMGDKRQYSPPMLALLNEAHIKSVLEVRREINGWQLEWDGERSTACHAVNLSGKAKLVLNPTSQKTLNLYGDRRM